MGGGEGKGNRKFKGTSTTYWLASEEVGFSVYIEKEVATNQC